MTENDATQSDGAQRENIPFEQYEHLSAAMDEMRKVDLNELPKDVAIDVEDTFGRFGKYYDLVENDPLVADGGQAVEDSTYQVAVWGTKEYVVRVEGDTLDEGEQNAREFVQMEYGVQSDDILSVNPEDELADGRIRFGVWGKNEWVVTVDAKDEKAAEDAARERVQFEHDVRTADISSINVEAEL